MWPLPDTVICAIAGAVGALVIGAPVYRGILKYRFRKAIEGFNKTQPAGGVPNPQPESDDMMSKVIKACDGLLRTAGQQQHNINHLNKEVGRVMTWANDVNGGIGLLNDRLGAVERAMIRFTEAPPIPTPTVAQRATAIVQENPAAYPETPPYQYIPNANHQAMLDRIKELEGQNEQLQRQVIPPPLPTNAYAG